jgi:hypothetical protein
VWRTAAALDCGRLSPRRPADPVGAGAAHLKSAAASWDLNIAASSKRLSWDLCAPNQSHQVDTTRRVRGTFMKYASLLGQLLLISGLIEFSLG